MGRGKFYGKFLAIHLSKPLDKLKVSQYPILLGYFNFGNNPVDSDVSSVKPLSIGLILILTNSSLTRVQEAKEIKTIGSLLCCSSCRLLFSMVGMVHGKMNFFDFNSAKLGLWI